MYKVNKKARKNRNLLLTLLCCKYIIQTIKNQLILKNIPEIYLEKGGDSNIKYEKSI